MENYYGKFIGDSLTYIAGKKLSPRIISQKNSGRMNLSPSLSPDGKYLAYFSEKDVFTLDLYLADATFGKIIKKLSSVTRSHDIDDFSFNESSGTWSPDSKKFAFVVFQKGKNRLVFVDVRRARITDEIELGNIASFSNPEWSPNGRYIAFSGLVEGIGDLYLYDLRNENIIQLTEGFSSKIHPSWSPDWNFIVFVDEEINKGRKAKKFSTSLKIVNINTKEIQKLEIFRGADNLNPRFSHDGKTIYFLSNSDGFRNIYAYDTLTEKVFRLTNLKTGISGLTPYSPAMNSLNYSHLSGSRIAVVNAELRIPMTGPKTLALFGSKYFMTDLNLFFDVGLAWSRGDKPKITWEKAAFNQRVPVFSAGMSVRVNILGYLIIEPYFAIPFQNGGWQNKKIGLNFVPGW